MVDANGYPVDVKEQQRRVDNPFQDPSPSSPHMDAIDLEKLKHGAHSEWDKHTKIALEHGQILLRYIQAVILPKMTSKSGILFIFIVASNPQLW